MMVGQFKTAHGGIPPTKIVLTPQAALALALKEAYTPEFMGVGIEARPFDETEIAQPGKGSQLGIFMRGNPEALRACDLR